MGWLEGLLGGFTGRKQEYEAEQQALALKAQERENSLFTALLNSPDDEVRAAAVAGLVEGTQPGKRKPGLQGWLGEMQANPAYGSILKLIRSPVTETTTTPGLASKEPQGINEPARAVQPAITEPEGLDASMPATAITSPNAPPPKPLAMTPVAGPAIGRTDTTTRPRKVFASAAETAAETTRGQYAGRVQGVLDSLRANGVEVSPELAKQIALELSGYSAGSLGMQALGEGNVVPDPTSPTGYSQVLYHRQTGAEINRTPAMNPAFGRAGGLGQEREAVARELGLPSASAATPAQMQHINQVLWDRKARLLPAQILARVSTLFQGRTDVTFGDYLDAADALMQAQGAGLPGAPPPPPTASVPAGGPSAEGGSVSPAAPPPAAGTPPSASGAASAPGQPPAPTSLREKVTAGMPDSGKGLIDTGKPMPPAAAMLVGRSEANNALIDHALEALKAGGWDQKNTLQDSLDMAAQYRQGVYDPITEAASQLSDLAGLQTANSPALTQNAARAMQYFVQKRQHVPRLPGGRQTLANKVLPAGAVQSGSILMAGDEGGFDTPAMMYQKLLKARENNQTFITEIQNAYTRPATTSGTGTGGAPASKAVFENGQWVIKQ